MLIDADNSLAKLPWTLLSASYNKQLYIKKLFEDNYYIVLVTDCRNVWLEHVDASAIYERARDSEITVDEDKPERLIALVKILRTFLDNIQEVKQSADKLEIICSRKVGFANVPWIFHCARMTSSGLSQSVLDGPETLYKHLVAPTLILGSTYQTLYFQQRQQLIRMEQELNHLHELMEKAGLGTPSNKHGITDEEQNLKCLTNTVERLASKKDAMLQLITMPTSELMIKATQAVISENSGGVAHDAEHVVHNATAGTDYNSPIQEDLVIAAGLQDTLKGRSQPQLASSESAAGTQNAKTNKEIEQEKRAALRMAMADEESKRASKKKKLF